MASDTASATQTWVGTLVADLSSAAAAASPHTGVSARHFWGAFDYESLDRSPAFPEAAEEAARAAFSDVSHEGVAGTLVHYGIPTDSWLGGGLKVELSADPPYAEFFVLAAQADPLPWAIALPPEPSNQSREVCQVVAALAAQEDAPGCVPNDADSFERVLRAGGLAVILEGQGRAALLDAVTRIVARLDKKLAAGFQRWRENPPVYGEPDLDQIFRDENLIARRCGELATPLIRAFRLNAARPGAFQLQRLAHELRPPPKVRERIQAYAETEFGRLMIDLPTPLAQFVALVCVRSDYRSLDTLILASRAYERLLSFVALVAASAAGGREVVRGALANFEGGVVKLSSGPSIKIVDASLPALDGEWYRLASVLTADSEFMTRAAALRELRNDLMHARIAMTREGIASAGEEMAEGLRSMLSELARVMGDWLFLLVEANECEDGQWYARGVQGLGPEYACRRVATRGELPMGVQLLSAHTGRAIDLSEYFLMKECAACERWELFFAESMKRDGRPKKWRSLTTQHRPSTKAPA
jgi:hypothetical protein